MRPGVGALVGARETLRDFIRARELFDRDECRALVELADSLDGWRPATVARKGQRVVYERSRRALQLDACGERADERAAERVAPWLERVEQLVRQLDGDHFHLGVQGIESAQLVRYGERDHYRWHRDALDHRKRKLTALCYLTDRHSHGLRGGETSFAPRELSPLLRRRWLRSARAGWLGPWLPVETPRCGRAIVFDATVHHRAHRVRRGTKVVLNVWFH